MKNFTKGVSYYTFGTARLAFPEDDLCCYRPAPRDIVGLNCPITFEGSNNEHDV